MKRILLILAVTAIAQFSYAQFTTSGGNTTTTYNVGIGTLPPNATLDVLGRSPAGNSVNFAGYTAFVANDTNLPTNGTYSFSIWIKGTNGGASVLQWGTGTGTSNQFLIIGTTFGYNSSIGTTTG